MEGPGGAPGVLRGRPRTMKASWQCREASKPGACRRHSLHERQTTRTWFIDTRQVLCQSNGFILFPEKQPGGAPGNARLGRRAHQEANTATDFVDDDGNTRSLRCRRIPVFVDQSSAATLSKSGKQECHTDRHGAAPCADSQQQGQSESTNDRPAHGPPGLFGILPNRPGYPRAGQCIHKSAWHAHVFNGAREPPGSPDGRSARRTETQASSFERLA